jgi:hypothetical protein
MRPIACAFAVFTERFGDFKPSKHNLLGAAIAETVFGRVRSTILRIEVAQQGTRSSPRCRTFTNTRGVARRHLFGQSCRNSNAEWSTGEMRGVDRFRAILPRCWCSPPVVMSVPAKLRATAFG